MKQLISIGILFHILSLFPVRFAHGNVINITTWTSHLFLSFKKPLMIR